MFEPILDYIVVGGGVFGASTALHLRLSKPEATVTLFDDNGPDITASRDINKVFRTRYCTASLHI